MAEEQKSGEMQLDIDALEVIDEIRITDPAIVKAIKEAKEQGAEGGVTIRISW